MSDLRPTHAHTPENQREKQEMITSRMRRRLKQELSTEKPTVWIGKEGSTPQIMNEINRQLEQREVIKAKILQAALTKENAREVAKKIAEHTSSTIIDVRGHTFVLYKPKKRKSLGNPAHGKMRRH